MAEEHAPAAPAATKEPAHDRRRFLSALAGGFAALWLRAVGSTPTAEAANGNPFVLGTTNDATVRTRLDVEWANGASQAFYVGTNQGIAMYALTEDARPGIEAFSGGDGGTGAHGIGTVGLQGEGFFQNGRSTVGVQGLSSDPNGIGVQGQSTGSNSSGVFGSGNIGVFGTSSTGAGVFGESGSSTAVGVIAKAGAAGGLALRVEGFPQFFSTSGRVNVAAGQKAVSVPIAGVVPTDTVLATVQGGGTVSVRTATAHIDKITITITKASMAPVPVGYLVIRN